MKGSGVLRIGCGAAALLGVVLAGCGDQTARGALDTAAENAQTNGLAGRFTAVRSDWFRNLSGQYDVIVSNPPYIRSDVIPTLDREVREHDPLLALDGGADGLDAYRVIAAEAEPFLKSAGIVAVETGYDQRDAVREVFEAAGFEQVAAVNDLAGNDRAQAFKAKS